MKTKKPNAELVWKQLEDVLAPRLRLSVTDRTVYSHLLRHSRLERKLRLQFSIMGLGRTLSISTPPVRNAVRRVAALGALRIVRRSKSGYLIEVRLPDEIRSVSRNSARSRFARQGRAGRLSVPMNLEDVDFMQTKPLRKAIHARERGQCFYCLSHTTPIVQCLDHVVPRSQFGRNSYRNLVSCCMECNARKGEKSAPDFLRLLCREHRLTAAEFAARLRALDALASGTLRPSLL